MFGLLNSSKWKMQNLGIVNFRHVPIFGSDVVMPCKSVKKLNINKEMSKTI